MIQPPSAATMAGADMGGPSANRVRARGAALQYDDAQGTGAPRVQTLKKAARQPWNQVGQHWGHSYA